jgi:hypothetical protein
VKIPLLSEIPGAATATVRFPKLEKSPSALPVSGAVAATPIRFGAA